MNGRTIAIGLAATFVVVLVAWWAFSPPRGDTPTVPHDTASSEANRSPELAVGETPRSKESGDQAAKAGEASSATPDQLDPEAWLARYQAAGGDRGALERLAGKLRRIWPEKERYRVILAIYERVTDRDARNGLLDMGAHPARHLTDDGMVQLLWMGVSDPDPRIAERARGFLSVWAIDDLTKDPEQAAAWRERMRDATFAELIGEGIRTHLARLRGLEGHALAREINRFHLNLHVGYSERLGVDLRAQAREAGAVELFHGWWTDERNDIQMRADVLRSIPALGDDEAYLRRHVVPLLAHPNEIAPPLRLAAVTALAERGRSWALDVILPMFASATHKAHWPVLAEAVVKIGDRRAIPTMIGVIAADGTRQSLYGIGHTGLMPLTRVNHDEEHDGAWWRAWWTENRHKFPSASSIDIPTLELHAR